MSDCPEKLLRLDTRNSSVIAIRAAAYRFGQRFVVAVEPCGETVVNLRFRFGKSSSPEEVDGAMNDFLRELNDQVLREHVREETKHVRAVILAHAFSRTGAGTND